SSWMFVLLGALVGLWLGDFTGMIIGGLVGFMLGRLVRAAVKRRLASVRVQFLESSFAVMGAVCKADGVVSPNEIRVAEAVFVRLHLSPLQKEMANAAFKRGKGPNFALEREVDRFARSGHGGGALIDLFLQIQL